MVAVHLGIAAEEELIRAEVLVGQGHLPMVLYYPLAVCLDMSMGEKFLLGFRSIGIQKSDPRYI